MERAKSSQYTINATDQNSESDASDDDRFDQSVLDDDMEDGLTAPLDSEASFGDEATAERIGARAAAAAPAKPTGARHSLPAHPGSAASLKVRPSTTEGGTHRSLRRGAV